MSLLTRLEEWIKEALIDGIMANFSGLFDSVNEQTADIATQVGTSPAEWNVDIFSMVQNLSETVVLPIAGIILTFVLTYELIQMILEKNNMHDFDTFNLYKWCFKTMIAILILTNTFTIIMAVFDLAQWVVNGSADVIQGSMDVELAMDAFEETLAEMSWGALLGLWIESAIISLAMQALAMCVFIVVYGRMLQIYMTASIAPIPFATMVNREWGQTGNNYLRGLLALAFQGFLIMVCIAIYAALVQGLAFSDNVHAAIWMALGYTVLLCYTLFKTGSLSKQIFNSH